MTTGRINQVSVVRPAGRPQRVCIAYCRCCFALQPRPQSGAGSGPRVSESRRPRQDGVFTVQDRVISRRDALLQCGTHHPRGGETLKLLTMDWDCAKPPFAAGAQQDTRVVLLRTSALPVVTLVCFLEPRSVKRHCGARPSLVTARRVRKGFTQAGLRCSVVSWRRIAAPPTQASASEGSSSRSAAQRVAV
jgi:hypothetical protein